MQTSMRLLIKVRGETRARERVQLLSARDQDLARSFFRSLKLCLRTTPVHHFNTDSAEFIYAERRLFRDETSEETDRPCEAPPDDSRHRSASSDLAPV
jgi:hypothetical protein